MRKTESVAILVPAYNEGPRISVVLDVICSYEKPKRVIVIDDGSQDDTFEQASMYPVEVLKHEANRGKGAALQTGIDHVGYSRFWLFLDADLVNLRHEHMDTLLKPLEKDTEIGMTIGMFKSGGKLSVDLAQRFFGILNGQRGLADFFVKSLPSLSWSRFGVEVFLSRIARERGIPVVEPVLKGISHHTKEAKYGFRRGFPYRLQMFRECLYSLNNWHNYL
jgi:glycosyltransferase involved in cell wall biosynthesis